MGNRAGSVRAERHCWSWRAHQGCAGPRAGSEKRAVLLGAAPGCLDLPVVPWPADTLELRACLCAFIVENCCSEMTLIGMFLI